MTMQSKVTIYGNEAETVQMYGKEVWKKYTDWWETVFSDEAYFKESGSMTVNGLKPSDTVTVTAEATFLEFNGVTGYTHNDSVTQMRLPAFLSVYSFANIVITAGNGTLDFKFNPYTESFKGEVTRYIPVKLIITEVRVKR